MREPSGSAFGAALGVEPRRFVLQRDADVTGISGTGVVAWGVLFPDGTVVTRWCSTPIRQTCVWTSLDDVAAIHGHGGSTRIEWRDDVDELVELKEPG